MTSKVGEHELGSSLIRHLCKFRFMWYNAIV